MSERITYQQSGVDPEKAAGILASFGRYLKGRPKDPSLVAGIGPFASCYSLRPLLDSFRDPLLVTSCDGVGTKAKLALDWDHIEGLGQDLVAMNVNDLLCMGARPFLFLDYYACGKLREDQLLPLLKSIQAGCELAGCALAGGETAEMPGVYGGRDFDLAGFAVGIVDRDAALGAEKVRAGDRLVALASSGLHSNGYSLVRKVLEREHVSPDAKAPFGDRTWKEILLAPTTIYTRTLKDLVPSLHAAAHITGGGLFENLPRVLPDGTCAEIRAAAWPIPPLFQWFQERAGLSTAELLSTLNAGVGMILACAAEEVSKVISHVGREGIGAWEIGTVVAGRPGEAATVVWQ